MGMSADLEIAVDEGATMVRIGRTSSANDSGDRLPGAGMTPTTAGTGVASSRRAIVSMLKKTLIYLGLGPDDEYDSFDEYAPIDAGFEGSGVQPPARRATHVLCRRSPTPPPALRVRRFVRLQPFRLPNPRARCASSRANPAPNPLP